DGVLHGRATNSHKKIVFLESLESEAAVLEKWMNTRALKDMLDDLAGNEQRSKDMLAAYVAGDEAKLLAIQDSERQQWKDKGRPLGEYDEQMEDLLYKRNASWIAPIEKLHAEGGGFIAVGAAHLIGPKSVLELLQQQGFKITRVTP
ncbi:MAG TPA: TraB/GumN family protein, partial [Kofleriaceae bacterium]